MVTGDPPRTGTFSSAVSLNSPTQSPSGEKNGLWPPPVWTTTSPPSWSIWRIWKPLLDANATVEPSGAIAICRVPNGAALGRPSNGNDTYSGDVDAVGADRPASIPIATPASTAATSPAPIHTLRRRTIDIDAVAAGESIDANASSTRMRTSPMC